jgi:hypothetical protein
MVHVVQCAAFSREVNGADTICKNSIEKIIEVLNYASKGAEDDEQTKCYPGRMGEGYRKLRDLARSRYIPSRE